MFMYIAQTTKDRIKFISKEKKINMETMLADCSLGINAVRQISDTKGMASFSLAKIADYLDCSVDYLLGRTETPNAIFSGAADAENTDYIMTSDLRETMLVLDYRSLNKQGKEYLLQTMDMVKNRYDKRYNSVSDMEDIV